MPDVAVVSVKQQQHAEIVIAWLFHFLYSSYDDERLNLVYLLVIHRNQSAIDYRARVSVAVVVVSVMEHCGLLTRLHDTN